MDKGSLGTENAEGCKDVIVKPPETSVVFSALEKAVVSGSNESVEDRKKAFEIQIDMNVLNHLGMSLYSNTPAVLTEIISNSWDADARNVHIKLDKINKIIEIVDDGHGMTEQDIQNRFLTVGYARRNDGRFKSDSNKRQVMGRKGIGKLAMFSLANKIKVASKREGEDIVAFEIDVATLQERIKKGLPYSASKIDMEFKKDKGTKIVLENLKKDISKTESYLRKKISRRFSVIGEVNGFNVSVNDTPITSNDRDYLKDLEFMWEIGESNSERLSSASNVVKNELIPGEIFFKGDAYPVKGYIGSVVKPSDLKKDPEVSNNTITVISNGRIFDEDILSQFGGAKHYINYLVGEIEIDLLDENDLEDMATSARQKLQENDPRYSVLKAYFEKILQRIDKQWDEWRREKGGNEIIAENAALDEWYNKLGKSEKKAAKSLIGKINTMSFSGDKSTQDDYKREVIKNSVLAFEKLRVKDNLDVLEGINDLSSEMFRGVFSSIDEIEASMYYDITSQRLNVIDKFERISDKKSDELEKVVQEYLFDHLWLLDPSWDRISGTQQIETTLTKELKQAVPDSSKGARLDIEYKTISGKHLVIELKRPKISPKFDDLMQQGNKYRQAVRRWYQNNPASCPIKHGEVPTIEIIFLIGENVPEALVDKTYYENQLNSINGKIMTYIDLIHQSREAYQSYVDSQSKVKAIRKLVDSI